MDIPVGIAAGIDQAEIRDLAIDRPGEVRVAVLDVGGRERRDLQRFQRLEIRTGRILHRQAVRLEIFQALRDQDIPVVVDIVQSREAAAGIGRGIEILLRDREIVGLGRP